MSELEEALALAERLLDETNCAPDDDLRMLARQLTRRNEAVIMLKRKVDHYEEEFTKLKDTIKKMREALKGKDWEGAAVEDLIHANRDAILDMHKEAVRRVAILAKIATSLDAKTPLMEQAIAFKASLLLIGRIITALSLFHPMHLESWPGWPEGTEP